MAIKVPAEESSIVVSDEKPPTAGGQFERTTRADQLRDVSAVEYVPEMDGFRPVKTTAWCIRLDDPCQVDAVREPLKRRTAMNRHAEGQQVGEDGPVLHAPDFQMCSR